MTSPKRNSWQGLLRYFAEGLAITLDAPETVAPTPDEFVAFINGGFCPLENRLKAENRLNRLLALTGQVNLETAEWPQELLGDLDDGDLLDQIPQGEYVLIQRITKDGILECESGNSEEIQLHAVDLEEARTNLPVKSRAHSFLVPLMEAWVRNPELRPVNGGAV